MKEYRKAEKLSNGDWIQIEFRDLKIGDEFRLFEETGEPVNDGEIFEAVSIPYIEDLRKAYKIKVKGSEHEKSNNRIALRVEN